MAELTGTCLCGKVRWEAAAAPIMQGVCHCTDCQRAGGGPFAAHLFVPRPAFRIRQGTPRKHEKQADSGNTVSRFFCGDCGSQIYAQNSAMPDGVAVRASTLDDPSRFQPTMHVFAASAPEWAPIPDGLPKFARMPG